MQEGTRAVSNLVSQTPPASRADYVYRVLKEGILTGRLQPGDHIQQDDIAKQLGVSKTPVREALRRLESERQIVYRPHTGASVAMLDEDVLSEFYVMRANFEGMLVELAVPRFTEADVERLERIQEEMVEAFARHDYPALSEGGQRFHLEIAQIGGPKYMASLLEEMLDRAPIPHARSFWHNAQSGQMMLDEHQLILDAIKSGDAERAADAMREHMIDMVHKPRA